MNYDDYKLMTPPNEEEHNCRLCGEPLNNADGTLCPQCIAESKADAEEDDEEEEEEDISELTNRAHEHSEGYER